MRPLRFALPAAALCIATLAGAAEPPPSAGAPAALPYQLRMKACHAEARGRKGMARCEFLRECLHGGTPAAAGKNADKDADKNAGKSAEKNAGKDSAGNPDKRAEKAARKEVEKKTGKSAAESAPVAPPE
jgi:hypothetical protein